jgi:hypothetical protein
MDKLKQIEELRKKLLQMDDGEFDQMLNEGKETTQHQWNKKMANYDKTGGLLFYPEKIKELAKPYTTSQQMIDYRGENEEQINAAGRYIQYKKVERPEWFDSITKNNSETKEECLKIALDASSIENIEQRILDRLYKFYSKEELRELVPRLWKRRVWDIDVKKDDNYIYEILCTYNTIAEMRNKKIHKTLITKLQVGKEKYPKSYEKYKTMLSQPGNKVGSKRGNYKK